MRDGSPQTVGDSPKNTPRSTPPPSSVTSGIHQVRHMIHFIFPSKLTGFVLVHFTKENVGGTTYFYPAGQANSGVGNGVGGGGNGSGAGGDNGGGLSSHVPQTHHEYVPRPGLHYCAKPNLLLVNDLSLVIFHSRRSHVPGTSVLHTQYAAEDAIVVGLLHSR